MDSTCHIVKSIKISRCEWGGSTDILFNILSKIILLSTWKVYIHFCEQPFQIKGFTVCILYPKRLYWVSHWNFLPSKSIKKSLQISFLLLFCFVFFCFLLFYFVVFCFLLFSFVFFCHNVKVLNKLWWNYIWS